MSGHWLGGCCWQPVEQRETTMGSAYHSENKESCGTLKTNRFIVAEVLGNYSLLPYRQEMFSTVGRYRVDRFYRVRPRSHEIREF